MDRSRTTPVDDHQFGSLNGVRTAQPRSAPRGVEQHAFAYRTWPALPASLRGVRDEVRSWLKALPMGTDAADDLVLAVDAAASNCIEHAYRPVTAQAAIEVAFWTEGGVVCVEISDHGHWRSRPSYGNGRGHGIFLMLRLVESVLIHYGKHGTQVLLRQPLTADGAPATD